MAEPSYQSEDGTLRLYEVWADDAEWPGYRTARADYEDAFQRITRGEVVRVTTDDAHEKENFYTAMIQRATRAGFKIQRRTMQEKDGTLALYIRRVPGSTESDTE